MLWPGETAAWHFYIVPKKDSERIKDAYTNGGNKNSVRKLRGWGSIPVTVTIGKTTWKTSIFPDKRSGSYLLPLKAEVRKKEGLYAEQKGVVAKLVV
jgi:hypothetical protein